MCLTCSQVAPHVNIEAEIGPAVALHTWANPPSTPDASSHWLPPNGGTSTLTPLSLRPQLLSPLTQAGSNIEDNVEPVHELVGGLHDLNIKGPMESRFHGNVCSSLSSDRSSN